MNYDLAKTTESEIGYSLNQGMPYGDMPSALLASRFEETNVGEDEGFYDDHARRTLTNWGPDDNLFEHEQSRGGVNRNYGRLQLQYYGHRGNADDPYRPEHFDGFAGPEDRDPRGSNVDPDMKELRKQFEARTRFVRWSPDGSDHITGGARAEAKIIEDQQKVFKWTRARLKVFDRQLDGRRNGLRREYDHKSTVDKQEQAVSFGDYIKDYALNPQRRANVICREIIRNSRTWRDETIDSDLAVAKYNQACRRAQRNNNHNMVESAQGSQDTNLADGSDQKHYHAIAILMSNMVRAKRHEIDSAKGDTDLADVKLSAARKSAPYFRDLVAIMQSTTQDCTFGSSDHTIQGKTAMQVRQEHLARQVVYDAEVHHYHNAEIIYKSVRPGADLRKIKNQVIRDATNPEIRDQTTAAGRSAKRRMVTGKKLMTAEDSDMAESRAVFDYKRVLNPNGDRRIRLYSADQNSTESDASQLRRPNHTKYRITNANDTMATGGFGDNAQKERHIGVMGSKYMHNYIDRDSQSSDFSKYGA